MILEKNDRSFADAFFTEVNLEKVSLKSISDLNEIDLSLKSEIILLNLIFFKICKFQF